MNLEGEIGNQVESFMRKRTDILQSSTGIGDYTRKATHLFIVDKLGYDFREGKFIKKDVGNERVMNQDEYFCIFMLVHRCIVPIAIEALLKPDYNTKELDFKMN